MNSKLIAAAVVSVMVLAGATVLVAAPSDAAGGSEKDAIDLGSIYLDPTDSTGKKLTMKFNESAYTDYDFVMIKIYAQNTDSASPETLTWGETMLVDSENGFLFNNGLKVEYSGALGSNERTITVSSSSASGGGYIFLKLVMTVEPISGVTLDLNPVFYKIQVTVKDNGGLNITPSDIILKVGEKADIELTVKQDSSDGAAVAISDYTWYAEGLPSGLNLVVDGGKLKITGMASETDTDGAKVNVLARDNSGSELKGTFTITVNAADNISVSISNAKKASDGTYYVMQNATPVPTINITGATSSQVSVTEIMDSNRSSVGLTDSGSDCSGRLSITGVGTYIIEVSGPSGVVELTLHVIPQAAGSSVGLIVVGA